MSEERVIALAIALKAVLNTARERGVDVDQLSEATIDGLLKYRAYDALHVPLAIIEIGLAVDGLLQDSAAE